MTENRVNNPSLTKELQDSINPGNIIGAFYSPPHSPLQLLRETPFIGIGVGTVLSINQGLGNLIEQPNVADWVNSHVSGSEAGLIMLSLPFLYVGILGVSYTISRHFARRFLPSVFPSPQAN